jgi:two-component system, NarL family, nitrate/nitrite response regulator NarL
MYDGMANGRSRRVLIADPQPIFRLGLVALLESAYPDWDIIESDSVVAYRGELQQGTIDLLVVDSRLLGQETTHGLPVTGGLNSWVDIVAVTEPGDTIGALGCLAVGARSTVSRSDPASRTLATIEILVMHDGADDRTRSNARSSVPDLVQNAEVAELVNLTARQFDVLRLLAKGQSNKVIARDLGLSVSTVKVHLNTVFRALGARNRVEAVVRARPFQDRMTPHDKS